MSQEKTIQQMKEELSKTIEDHSWSKTRVKTYTKEELIERMEFAKHLAETVFGADTTPTVIVQLFSVLKDFRSN